MKMCVFASVFILSLIANNNRLLDSCLFSKSRPDSFCKRLKVLRIAKFLILKFLHQLLQWAVLVPVIFWALQRIELSKIFLCILESSLVSTFFLSVGTEFQ